MTTHTGTTNHTHIAVSANYYGTGRSPQEARKNLVRSGASPQEDQTVYRLPDGATDAYVANNGVVYWDGVQGELKPIYRYKDGKAMAWTVGGDAPIPYAKPPTGKKGEPKHPPEAQDLGEVHPEPIITDEVPDKTSTIVASGKTKRKVPPKPLPIVEVAAESAQEPADAPVETKPVIAHAISRNKAKKAKDELVTAAGQKLLVQETATIPLVVEPVTAAAKPATKAATSKPKLALVPHMGPDTKLAKEPKPAAEPIGPQDFLLFVGGAFYDKASFIEESAKLGISRRMPSHRLPKGLVSGKSKVYVAAEGSRSMDGEPISEVFGYFIPSRVEFVSTSGSAEHVEVIAALSLRKDAKIIHATDKEPERKCGTRQDGGTYIVVDKAKTPLVLLAKPAHYVGNHFRGMLKLDPNYTATFNDGGTVSVLIDEHCMNCGGAMRCSPDGHIRAERERKRIDKGLEPKWKLLDAKCAKEVRAARAADDGVAAAADVVDDDAGNGDPMPGTD